MAFYTKLSAASDDASSTVAKARVGKRISKGLSKYHLHHTSESGVVSGIAAYREEKSQDSAAGLMFRPSVEKDGSSFWVPLCTTQADGQTYSSGLQLLTKNDGSFLYSARILVTDEDENIVAIISVPSILFAQQSRSSAEEILKFLDSYVAAVQGVSLDSLEGALSVQALGYWVDVYTFADDEDDEDDED